MQNSMTVRNYIEGIPKLSYLERLLLIEQLTKSLLKEAPIGPYKGASVIDVRGIAKPNSGFTPDDKEVKHIIADSLREKYLR